MVLLVMVKVHLLVLQWQKTRPDILLYQTSKSVACVLVRLTLIHISRSITERLDGRRIVEIQHGRTMRRRLANGL
jgi:hypothetical protein